MKYRTENYKQKAIAAIFPLILFAGITHSQEVPDSTRIYQLDPVVITATQIEALRSRVPNMVSLITKEDILKSGETSVLTLLGRLVPGVFVTERGVLGYGVSNGAAGTIMIRGTGGSPNTEVLVMTDGRPQMMGLMGHPLSDTYVSSGVERVEVIRGPASLLYGTNAMGGVINIIYDKPPVTGQTLNAGASYGSFNTQKYELGGSLGLNSGSISVFANHYATDGERPYSSFNSSNGSIRSNVVLSERYAMNVDLNLTSFRTFDPGVSSKPLINNWVDITRGSAGISVENHSAATQGALKAFFNWGIHDIFDGFHSTDNNLGFQLYQGTELFEGNTSTIGIDYRHYGGIAANRLTKLDYGEHFVNEFSAYLLTQQKLLEALDASAGVRLNRHSLFGWETVPQVGLAFQASSSTTIKATTSKGFRSPTIRELYLFPAPTPTLEPERMWNYEIGVLQRIGTRGSVEVTGFVAEGSNIILTTGFYPNLKLSNSGVFTHRGIELSGEAALKQDLDLDITYTYLDPGDQTNANPKHKIHLGGTARLNPLTASVGFQYVSKLYGADFSGKPLPDYALLDARITTTVMPGLSAHIAGENLLDRKYQILYDYPMPGRTVFVGLNWALR
jgi:iron complex outermembrane receptor protein